MSKQIDIDYGRATLAELPAVVELCMQVEEQHEHYWPLRWQRREGLPEGYLRWFTKRMKDPDMCIAVARDRSTPDGADAPIGSPAAVTPIAGMVLASIVDEIPPSACCRKPPPGPAPRASINSALWSPTRTPTPASSSKKRASGPPIRKWCCRCDAHFTITLTSASFGHRLSDAPSKIRSHGLKTGWFR